MPKSRLETFTDRREAIVLFDQLRGPNRDTSWPLLPILAFIAPGGSGKSTLIEYLRVNKCCLPDRRAVLPYASLDFTIASTPKDLLSILITLRDQLQQHEDGQGKHLSFPRFDLGALIAQSALTTTDISSFAPSEIRRKLSTGKHVFEALTTLGNTLGYTVPLIPPLLAGLNLAGQIKPVNDLLRYLEDATGWKWYRMHGTATSLGANASMKEVLLRLHELSLPGKPEREMLVNELLPAAFIADLFDTLLYADTPRAWSKRVNVVLFLDGFEALHHSSRTTATRLLQVLTTEQRKRGTTDPLLLVVGSRDPLPGYTAEEQSIPFARTVVRDEPRVQQRVQELVAHWQQHLPRNRRVLRLKDLYLPLVLRDFGLDHTRSYLLTFGEQRDTQTFAQDDMLVQTIDRVTYGHPLFLALAAEAVVEAEEARGRTLTSDDFLHEEVSPEIAPLHESEQIGDYLLTLFLRQLSETEQKELICCAVPRFLDVALVRTILPSLDDIDLQTRWNYYRHLSFVSAIDDQRVVFHPLVRTLLLQALPANHQPDSDYFKIHSRLREHFHHQVAPPISTLHRAKFGWQAKIEEAYHALALGDPGPAIEFGIVVQRTNVAVWEPLLETVAQASTELIPANVEEQAYDAVVQAERHQYVQDGVAAIVLYTWLLTASQGNPQKVAGLQHNLGIAYWDLPAGDRAANLKQAIACYEAALQVRNREAFPVQWAMTQNNLGTAYSNLPAGDRAENLKQAIACYEAALQVRTREAFPVQWATTQNNLGTAYRNLPAGDQAANLKQAIACYEAALQVYTREAFPVDWAMTQNNLGTAYKNLPAGDRAANLKQAIACYEAALQVYTREAFPVDWAMTQNNLGIAYRNLPAGDQAENLKQAIACYEAALQVRTREAFPVDWAMTQNNLGIAYSDLPAGDQAENLKQAIACYEAALQVRTREAFPVQWAMTQNNLGTAYKNLPAGDQAENLKQAIACYEAALQVYTRETFPVQWATTQNNLGTAYRNLPAGDRAANLKQAIACYEAALQVRTRETFPVQWATTQNNLGTAYSDLPAGDRAANLKQAIACYEAALQVRTREAFPVDWAMTQNNLGTAYSDLPAGDRAENLKQAIACYEAALQVRTRETFPVDWAMTQNNLGNTYSDLPAGDRAANLKQAIACYEAALQVFHLAGMDYYLPIVSGNLETAKDALRNLEED